MKFYCVSNQMKATEQYFFCGTVYGVGGSNLIESVDEILRCDHSNESY